MLPRQSLKDQLLWLLLAAVLETRNPLPVEAMPFVLHPTVILQWLRLLCSFGQALV